MPLELPGFYWDESRNRYFPISSKPKQENEPQNEQLTRTRSKRRRIWDNNTQSIGNYSHRQRNVHEMMCSHIVSTSRLTRATIPFLAQGAIASFCTTLFDGRTHSFLGDTRGWMYSLAVDEEAWNSPPSSTEFSATRGWVPELNLASGISSICISGSRCIATSFGPSCKILVQDVSLMENTYILSPGDRVIHDIWTSDLQDRSVAIGANTKAIFIQDIDTARSLKILNTYSDVFAVHQQPNLLYTGTRDSGITRFDLRLDKPEKFKLLGEGFAGGSVTHLDTIHDWQLLYARINGELGTFDLRFPRESTPLMKFEGHVNEYLPRLPVVVDPSQEFLFAAGQDRRIRVWSLRTGEHLVSDSSEQSDQQKLFNTQFGTTIQSLRISQERNGLILWAASDEGLFRYHLGQTEN